MIESGRNVLKPVLFVTDKEIKQVRVFVPSKPFQLSLIFTSNARRVPQESPLGLAPAHLC